MPKEIAHWTLAEKTAARLPDHSTLKSTINSHRSMYYLGAVILDTPFYCLYGRNAFKTGAAQNIHDNSTNSFSPLISLINNVIPLTPPIISMVLGLISHIFVDATFHPMVNYFSGDKRNPQRKREVQYRHHELETLIDLYFMNQVDLINKGRFYLSYRSKELDESSFLNALSCLYFNRPDLHLKLISRSLKHHGWVQKLFWKKWLRQFLKVVNYLPGLDIRPEIALIYPQSHPLHSSFFTNPISYQHPVNNKEFHENINDLAEKAISAALETFSRLENNTTSESISAQLKKIPAPNMNTGLVGIPSTKMVNFDPTLNFDEVILSNPNDPKRD